MLGGPAIDCPADRSHLSGSVSAGSVVRLCFACGGVLGGFEPGLPALRRFVRVALLRRWLSASSSRTAALWTSRSTIAIAMVWSGKMLSYFEKGWLAVIFSERRS